MPFTKKKMFKLTLGQALLTLLIGSMAIGCSSVRKVDYDASTNPSDEIKNMDQAINSGMTEHYDILASKDFTAAQDEFNQAKEQMAKGKSQEKVMDSLGYAQAYLNRAKDRANLLHDRSQGILDARTAALDAGVRNLPNEAADFRSEDDTFRSSVDKLADGQLSTESWAAMQKGYSDLELRTIQKTRLAEARAKIDNARKNKAAINTPHWLAKAERDLQNAKNVIAVDRHNETAIQPAVDRANASADYLLAVLDATKQKGGDVSEAVATALVKQNRNIHDLRNRLKATSDTNASMVGMEQALDSARKAFSPDEAEVYRQGDKLLIRLKAINFVSGRSELPTDALPLLAKVKTVAAELNPSAVVVEGHTDSTGSEQVNEALSQERAQSVATYFENNGLDREKVEVMGFGYKKPLASNKTAEGRAQNRRVDVLITPSQPETQSTME
jgi:OOP family OmpA-OmpF porin